MSGAGHGSLHEKLYDSVNTYLLTVRTCCTYLPYMLAMQATHELGWIKLCRSSSDSFCARSCKYLRWFAWPTDEVRNASLGCVSFGLLLVRPCSPVSIWVAQASLCGWAGPAAASPPGSLLVHAFGYGRPRRQRLFVCRATQAARGPYRHLIPLCCLRLQLMRVHV